MVLIGLFRKLPVRSRNRLKDSNLYFMYTLFQNLNLAFFSKQKFFGQTEEDKLIIKYLPETKGLYLDIGAGQPVCGSNTYHFYRKGWQGICVDPIVSNGRMLRLLRNRDSIIQALVSTSKGTMNFWEFVPYEYSTTIPSVAEKLKLQVGVRFKRLSELEVFSLSEIAPPNEPAITHAIVRRCRGRRFRGVEIQRLV